VTSYEVSFGGAGMMRRFAMDVWGEIRQKVKSLHSVLMLLITLGYLLGTHLSTIHSLEMALASKAERSELISLDKKLTRIEVMLEEAIMMKQQWYELRDNIEQRMTDITIRMHRLQEGESADGK